MASSDEIPGPVPQKTTDTQRIRKKRGSRGAFQGQRLAFLTEFMPKYIAKSKNKTRSKRGTEDNVWDEIFVAYWTAFPWRLPLGQDPLDDGVDYALALQDDEERERKSKLITQTEDVRLTYFTLDESQRVSCPQKIKNWYNRQRSAVGLAGNPFSQWLSRLRAPDGPPPKRLHDYQFYMQHPDYKPKVIDQFLERHPDAPCREHLKLKCDIARELLESEDQAVKDMIHTQARAEHEQNVEDHKDALEGLPALDEEGQQL
jgi:hypothetical protein